jgi:hypothetical protein
MRSSDQLVGTSYGLTATSRDEDPEQVYVYADPDADTRRPIEIQGWCGYSIPNRMNLTRKQAEELRDLLTESLDRVPIKPDGYLTLAEGESHAPVDARPMRFFKGKWEEI